MRPRLLLVLGAAALLFRLGYGWLRPPQPPEAPLHDPDSYAALAASVARSGALLDADGRPSALREPVYPLLLGAFFKLLGARYAAVLLCNALLGAASALLIFLVGRRLFGETAALLAAALACVYPPFLHYASLPFRETAMTLAGLAALGALIRAHGAGTLLAWALAGAAAALAALTNTTFLPFGLCVVPSALLCLARPLGLGGAPLRRRLAWSLAYAAVLAAVYSPWPLRNAARFGTFVLGSTAGAGSTFYTYLIVPQEYGGTPRQGEIAAADPVMRGAAALGPVEREQYFWKASLERIRERPFAYLRLVAWRLFLDQYRLVPRPRDYGGASYRLVRLVSLLSDGWILPLALAGLLLARLREPRLLWVYLFLLSFGFTYALIFTMIRYRIAQMPWLILLACFGLAEGRRLISTSNTGPGRFPWKRAGA